MMKICRNSKQKMEEKKKRNTNKYNKKNISNSVMKVCRNSKQKKEKKMKKKRGDEAE